MNELGHPIERRTSAERARCNKCPIPLAAEDEREKKPCRKERENRILINLRRVTSVYLATIN
jgi:hypothetical protein